MQPERSRSAAEAQPERGRGCGRGAAEPGLKRGWGAAEAGLKRSRRAAQTNSFDNAGSPPFPRRLADRRALGGLRGPADRRARTMQTFLDRYDLFVFDLDGTVADTREDLAAAVNETLRRLGRKPIDVDTVTRFVGDGVRMLLERALGEGESGDAPGDAPGDESGDESGRASGGASGGEIDRAVDVFLGIYGAGCTRRTSLYRGVRETLNGLGEKDLAVLTNKPLAFTRKILEHLAVDRYFSAIEGGDSAPARKPDPKGLIHIATSLGHSLQRTILVGDSSTDILTARAAGAASAFVGYGFRPDAWKETPPDYRLRSLLELLGSIHR